LSDNMSNNDQKISAIILSGGRGSRMLNQDKGLQRFGNKMLIEHLIERIQPQVDEIIISHNRNSKKYLELGLPLANDGNNEFQGPLAGILGAKPLLSHRLCFIAPCDMPNIPLNIVEQLRKHLAHHDAVSVSLDGRDQPLLSLLRTQHIDSIEQYLNLGKRSVKGWLETLDLDMLELTGFKLKNINSLAELAQS